MAILLDANSRIICQGITGATATFHCEKSIAYGSNLVGGVRPGKGGSNHLSLPVFDTVEEAKSTTGADVSLVFVPPQNAADAIIEAIDARIPLIVCVTERVPVLDMVRVRKALEGSASRLIGPNSQGIITPEQSKVGVMPTHRHFTGPIGVISRSASLTYEAIDQLYSVRLGQSTSIGIGGDAVFGIDFVDCLELFLADDKTEGILLIGEIGGTAEEEMADFLKHTSVKKPVAAYIAGKHAPTDRRMGHAGTVNVFGTGSAAEKIAALASAGVHMADSAAVIGTTMRLALGR